MLAIIGGTFGVFIVIGVIESIAGAGKPRPAPGTRKPPAMRAGFASGAFTCAGKIPAFHGRRRSLAARGGNCTQVGYVADHPGYDVDAIPVRPLENVVAETGPAR